MTLSSKSLLLFRLARTRRPAAAPDPADVGTAFGMELSLGPVEHEPPLPALGTRPPGRWLARRTPRRP